MTLKGYGASMNKERTLKDRQVGLDNPVLQDALARADALIKKAQFNEAIRLTDDLEREIATMPLAKRFSRIKKPSDSVIVKDVSTMNPVLRGLTEAEYKRMTLILAVHTIRGKILAAVQEIKTVIMDMEAAKRD